MEGTVHKQKQGLSSAYHWKSKVYALFPQSNTTMEQNFALIKGLRRVISPLNADEWGRGAYVDTVKTKLKVTHLEYRH